MAKAAKAIQPPTKQDIARARESGIIVTPWTPPAKTPKAKDGVTQKKGLTPLSPSQARRMIRDLEYFVKTGEITQAQYYAQRVTIVLRMQANG